MTKKFIWTIIALLFCIPIDIISQPLTIFFSVTGDTVCYSDLLIPNGDKGLRTYIKKRGEGDTSITISTFLLDCELAGCIETLNKDTVKKYNLQFDGTSSVWGPKNDFIISVKPTNTRLVDTSAFGPKFIYQTKAVVFVSCKGQKIYSDQFDIMFKGNSPADFPERDIVRIKAWRKKNTKKYFLDIDIKVFQTFKKPGDTPDYHFKSFQFIL